MKAVKQDAAFDQAPRLNQYEMELSRGASHIASTLYEESMLAAVSETILEFEASHGRDDLKAFAHALLGRLEQRGKPLAGKVLQHLIERGRLPEEVPSALPVPVSARKSVARKLKGTALRAANARQAA
ncbi:hypothetical protein [Paraburkholderia fynbosensis]|uniref:Uncharacterized protein n=1 Tax=Paraburkholderia fynbosensis TaxID=1200993 RepID=A0A6J5H356_9BURK|nr:hypothetical protein [Paraburkholderia fynbosensis]CAB3810813.1 hypothetical protein LMG27177_07490 [Paraburkholderia fynbosensis]